MCLVRWSCWRRVAYCLLQSFVLFALPAGILGAARVHISGVGRVGNTIGGSDDSVWSLGRAYLKIWPLGVLL